MRNQSEGRERLERFKAARERLRSQYGARGASKALTSLLSLPTLSRLKASEDQYPSHRFSQTVQNRLIYLLSEPKAPSLYEEVATMLGQRLGEKDELLHEYLGDYVYFRYSGATNAGNLKYVTGRLRIFEDERGNPSFDEWSPDWARQSPERQGYVLRYENRLYFFGVQKGEMRLIVAQTFDGKSSESSLSGIVLSARQSPHRDPYAARILIVPRSNYALIDQLTSESGGEEAFRRFAEPDAAQFLLTY